MWHLTKLKLPSATVTSILSGSLIESVIDTSDDLGNVPANEPILLIGVLLLIIGAVAVFNIPALLYPILQKYSKGLALSYFGFRIFEAILYCIDITGVLLLISLSKEYVNGGALDASYVQAFGTLILAARDWGFLLVPIVFGLGALVFYYILWKSKLIPQWLSGWGLIGAALVVLAGVSGMFGNFFIFLALPIAVQEMVLAVWLIVKGFAPQEVKST